MTCKLQNSRLFRVVFFAVTCFLVGCSIASNDTNLSASSLLYRPISEWKSDRACEQDSLQKELKSNFVDQIENVRKLNAAAVCLAANGRLAESLEVFSESINSFQKKERTEPENSLLATTLKDRAIVYWTLKQYDHAAVDLTAAIELEPQNWELFFHRWHAYRAKGDHSKADADREHGKKLHPEPFDRDYEYDRGVI